MSSDHKKEHAAEKPAAPAEEKKSLKKWIIIGAIIALVLVIIAAAAVFFILKGKKQAAEKQESVKEEKKGKEEEPEKEGKKDGAEPKKLDEKSFFPAIYFSEKLTLPLAKPVKEGEEKVKRMTLKKAAEEKPSADGQKFLIVKIALEFSDEKEKQAFEEFAPEFLEKFGEVVAMTNKDAAMLMAEKIRFKLELARIAEKVGNGRHRPKNIYFTEFTIQ